METEQSTISETPSTPVPESAPKTETQSPQNEGEQKPVNGYEGKEFVEFTPEQQKRINNLTKKASNFERESQEYRTIAQQQFELINELRQGQGQIVSHLQEKNFAETESSIKAQRKEAYARGDIDAVDVLNDKLTDIKVQKKLADAQPKHQPRQQIQQQPQGDPVQAAVQRGEISRSDAQVFQDWQNEEDANGNLVRPWTSERHQKHGVAASFGRGVFSDPDLKDKPFGERLKEIDRLMGVQPRQSNQGVMGSGNLTGNGKTSNVKLSDFAENVAVRTNFAGKGKSRAEHIEAYRRQMSDIRGAKR